jgi:hypothetical protein
MEKLIDLGKYIEIELINWKITFPDCGELLIALYRGRLIERCIAWHSFTSLLHWYGVLIMLMPVKVL